MLKIFSHPIKYLPPFRFEFFRKFSVNEELGVLTWENEVDIAPETLYAEATGEPLPQWMTNETVP